MNTALGHVLSLTFSWTVKASLAHTELVALVFVRPVNIQSHCAVPSWLVFDLMTQSTYCPDSGLFTSKTSKLTSIFTHDGSLDVVWCSVPHADGLRIATVHRAGLLVEAVIPVKYTETQCHVLLFPVGHILQSGSTVKYLKNISL